HSAHDALRVANDKQCAFVSLRALRNAGPERQRLLLRHWLHEADRRAVVYAIDQYLGEFLEFLGRRAVQAIDFH
ncbi:MAG: TilS substrate-binding domain-containing protein, partial [Ramlibacter sp.]|nr:TilS substrate-binding domain-containing protein [Ramlibacter sp.]